MNTSPLQLIGDEFPDELIKKLVHVRSIARTLAPLRAALRARPQPPTQDDQEAWLFLRSKEIEVGRFLAPLCAALAEDVPLTDVRDALGANRARWDETLSQLGNDNTGARLMVLLGEENSGTRDDDDSHRPLNWCLTMAMMNATCTSPKMDEAIHNATNEFFGGAFGEWKERPLMERLAGCVV